VDLGLQNVLDISTVGSWVEQIGNSQRIIITNKKSLRVLDFTIADRLVDSISFFQDSVIANVTSIEVTYPLYSLLFSRSLFSLLFSSLALSSLFSSLFLFLLFLSLLSLSFSLSFSLSLFISIYIYLNLTLYKFFFFLFFF